MLTKTVTGIFAVALLLTASQLQAQVTSTKANFDALDMDAVAAEDLLNDPKGGKYRIAIGHDVSITPATHGTWREVANERLLWEYTVETPDAQHLNFGFKPYRLPEGAVLMILAGDLSAKIGPYSARENAASGEFWTPILRAKSARLQLEVPRAMRDQVELGLSRISQGYRGFGAVAAHCKAGACNMDVACLGDTDPWNQPRRSVGAFTVNGSDTCTGSLVNNTLGDRRMLFLTASHCSVTNANAAGVVVYWNYESPQCRTPGSAASGQVIPRPTSTQSGATFLARTQSPFGGGTGPGNTRSDVAMLELNGAPNPAFNLYWAGWDRTFTPAVCSQPPSPSSTAGLCASIHHPGVDEKRITFVQQNLVVGNIAAGQGVHWTAFWDPTPPILPNIPGNPQPTALPPGVTEPGSSGSPLYNSNQQLVGVLSGGPSACGATGASLSDQYGQLAHAWEGTGTAPTRMRDLLDPGNTGASTFNGVGQCTQPAAPTNLSAVVNGNNRIDLAWTATSGITRYRVFRTFGACGTPGFVQLAEVTGTSYSDLTVSGGSPYSYRVTALDTAQPCESSISNCSGATATGLCTLAPGFAGLNTAVATAQTTCGVQLNWNAAITNCGAAGSPRYNLYRSTTANFTPAPGNLLASCRTGLNFVDTAVQSGTRYHYAVRAEDGSGPGLCGGVEETNTVRRDAVPTGPDAFFDSMEPPVADWAATGTGAGSNFSVVTTQAFSPTRSWFVAHTGDTSRRLLTLNRPFVIAPGSQLQFQHRFDMEESFDGGILEYSLDGGTTWSDILAAQGSVAANPARFVAGGYTASMVGSVFTGQSSWSGSFNTAWRQTVVNLNDFNGRTIRLRLRSETDSNIGRVGWWIDDVRISTGAQCATQDVIFNNGFE